MQTILGFLFDFKSNAGKTFKKVRNEIVQSTKAWGKAIAGFTKTLKNMSKVGRNSFKAMLGDMHHFANELKKKAPAISDVISQIGDNFGGVAGILADTLMRPGALMAAGLATAANAAIGFKDTITETGRETGMSAEQLEKFGDSLKTISASMRAPLSQVESLGKRFASANISVDEFNDLMLTAISMNRVTGQETSMFAREILAMRGQLKLGSKDIQDFYNSLYGAAQATEADLDTLTNTTNMLIDLVGRTLPENLRKVGMESGIKLAAGISQALGDEAPGVISQLYSVMIDKSNPERGKFLTAVSALGTDAVAQFEEAVGKGDIYEAFNVLKKSIDKIDPSQFMQIKNALGDTLGYSVDLLQKIKGVNTEYYGAAASAADMAKSTNKIASDGKTMMTTAQRWHKIWGDVERILLPIGEVLMDIVNYLMKALEPITKAVSQFMSALGSTGKTVLAIVVGVGLVKIAFGPLLAIATQFAATLVSASATLLGMPGAIMGSVAAMGRAVAMTTVLNGGFSGIFGSMSAGIGALMRGMMGFIKVAWVAALPFIKIIAILWTIDAIIKEVTQGQYGLMDVITGALKVIAFVIGGIAKLIGGIVAAVRSLFSGDSKYWNEYKKNIRTDYSQVSEKKNNPVQVGSYQPVDMPAASPQDTTLSSASSNSSFVSGDTTRNPRKEFGTDDMISAQYETAEMIVKAIMSASTPKSSIAVGPVGNPARHVPIPEPGNIGSPR